MNKSIPFGWHQIGANTVIKLNVNLTSEDAHAIRNTFNFNVMRIGRKQLHRIEGVISWRNNDWGYLCKLFYDKLQQYKLNAKIEKLANEKANLLDKSIDAINLHCDLNDLPF